MDIRFFAWKGYQLREVGTSTGEVTTICKPVLTTAKPEDTPIIRVKQGSQ